MNIPEVSSSAVLVNDSGSAHADAPFSRYLTEHFHTLIEVTYI